MALHRKDTTTANARTRRGIGRRGVTLAAGLLAAGALTAGIAVPAAFAATTTTTTGGGIIYGTLDTQTSTAANESQAGVKMAMFELNWSSFEPTQGTLSSSYLATMKQELAAYQAAGQQVTLGLGLQNPPSWVFNLPQSRYVDQNGNTSSEANFVFSQAVRTAAAGFLALVAKNLPMSAFWSIRLTSGGDGEMLYPGGGTYFAFDTAALTGNGLAAGMTRNPDPNWKPGTAGLSQAQIDAWVNWYIGGLDNVTNWQMTTLASLGFTGYYEAVTPGSGSRPDYLAQEETNNLNGQSTTGVGAVWDRYYAMLPNKTNVIAYISSVADNSGGNSSCQASDTSVSLTSATMDSWSSAQWISRIAHQNGMAIGGENPGYGLPASLNSFYTDATATGMMATALNMARTCGFTVFYWAHDLHLWDGTIPFTRYATSVAPAVPAVPVAVNLALTGTVTASGTASGFPATAANDASQDSYWQAAGSTATLTLHLAQAAPVARIALELPQSWGTRNQVIQVDGSTNGSTWTTLARSATYQFTAGSNVVSIPVTTATATYLRLDISGNDAQGAPQISEFQAYAPVAVNLALTGTVTASGTASGFPATAANDASQDSYWQAAGSTATLTLHLAQAAPVARIALELPQSWGTRNQVIQVDGSTNGSTWTTLARSATYQFTAGSNVVSIPVTTATATYLRLDISGNDAQGAPQISEFQAYSS